MRSASPAAYALIREFESLVLRARRDPVGVPTNGYGHTRGVELGDVVDSATAEFNLRADVGEAERTIARYVPAGIIQALPQACYDALVSFIFNVGEQAFVRADGRPTQFRRALLGPDRVEVARQMQRWVKGRVNGELVVLPGLVRRRGAEAALWGAGLEARCDATPRAIAAVSPTPEPPRTKLLEQPATVAAAGAGAAGAASVAASALTSAGQSMTYSGDRVALIIGVALIVVGTLLIFWVAKR